MLFLTLLQRRLGKSKTELRQKMYEKKCEEEQSLKRNFVAQENEKRKTLHTSTSSPNATPNNLPGENTDSGGKSEETLLVELKKLCTHFHSAL